MVRELPDYHPDKILPAFSMTLGYGLLSTMSGFCQSWPQEQGLRLMMTSSATTQMMETIQSTPERMGLRSTWRSSCGMASQTSNTGTARIAT